MRQHDRTNLIVVDQETLSSLNFIFGDPWSVHIMY